MAEPRPSDPGRLESKWTDFDDEEVYERVKGQVDSSTVKNFVVEFGKDVSRIALNLDLQDFQTLFNTKRDHDYPIRWINTWMEPSSPDDTSQPTRERMDTIEKIGHHYGFSRRLRTSIKTWDQVKPMLQGMKKHQTGGTNKASVPAPAPASTTNPGQSEDLEKGLAVSEQANRPSSQTSQSPKVPTPEEKAAQAMKMMKLRDMQLVYDSLNYTTIDHGVDKFVCIGANWLYKRPQSAKPLESLVPPSYWAWYALCYDPNSPGATAPDTVLTFYEAPYHGAVPGGEDEAEWKHKVEKSLKANARRNLLQLSKHGITEYEKNIIELTAVRSPQQSDSSSISRAPTLTHDTTPLSLECSSNLFYYLFEDYLPALAVLNDCSDRLQNVERRILHTAKHKSHSLPEHGNENIIPSLYRISKDLRQLQHLFSSYKVLIQRVLDFSAMPTEHPPLKTAKLAPSARDRFERLSDRLQLLMLNTIQEYLDENSSLLTTYFNLTAQKDSQATARLTRSATLLAKLSVLFLPVSFITAYFSIQIPEITAGYTANSYWGTFGVTLFLSFLSLFFFSKVLVVISDTLEESSAQLAAWFKHVARGQKQKGMPEED
ncbi:hypothetical protein QBC46DRAFT_381604 [Diplogelasinospora grovesii]|uniref:ADP-ribosylation factor n=1 Tax=Diplogelasinospora grovesii TaxID=303347 RepID=A0AAN6NB85_9PEZI|nr:hypothetical protein QBC46DRAFT_381604 [Diplogelasinospora grovesii]